MNFLKEKIQKYNEKKLKDALKKMKFYTDAKKQLEIQLTIATDYESKIEIKEKIEHHNEFINIWKKNIDVINKQSKKLE
ncbi:MAG: hypothetical protein KGZ34_03255 [Nitrosarchaeum sp.]|nr:hypothetical protein [Nitrosarchaeum sp.]